jgi:UDP-N-acetyl-D-galactosamine dehydrogenase
VPELIRELQEFSINVDAVDPMANAEEFHNEYGITLAPKIGAAYDAVLVAVNHEAYAKLDESWFMNLTGNKGLLYDVKGIYRNKIKTLAYLSL